MPASAQAVIPSSRQARAASSIASASSSWEYGSRSRRAVVMALSARKPSSCGVPSGSSSSTAVLTTQACPESCIRKTLRP